MCSREALSRDLPFFSLVSTIVASTLSAEESLRVPEEGVQAAGQRVAEEVEVAHAQHLGGSHGEDAEAALTRYDQQVETQHDRLLAGLDTDR